MASRGRAALGLSGIAAAGWALTAMPLGIAAAPTTYADDLDRVSSHAHEEARVAFRIRSAEITESSSLVVSTTLPRLAYTTNDSGDGAVVYTVETRTGEVVGRTTLAGAEAFDIEALGGGADGSLVVADIGDNSAERGQVSVYRIDQPDRGDRTVTPDVLSLRYVDGPRDAESVLYDAESGRVFVISKEFGSAAIYRSGRDAFARGRSVLRPVAAAPPLATDATYLPGGDYVVVRGYVDASVFRTTGWSRVATFSLPSQQQGESIAAPRGRDVVWVGTEGSNSPVHEVRLPELPELPGTPGGPSSGAEPTESGGPTAGEQSSGTPSGATHENGVSTKSDQTGLEDARVLAIWVGGGALVALVVLLLLIRSRSRRSAN